VRRFHRAAYLTAALCLLLIAVPSVALCASHVEATLSVPEKRDAEHPAIVSLELRNSGDEPVSILKWNTPFVQSGGRLPKPLFVVRDAEGRDVRYRGTFVNFAGVVMDSFIVLNPGEVLRKDIDLIEEYRYGDGGAFTVTYTLNLSQTPDPNLTSEAERRAFYPSSQGEVESNSVIIEIDGPTKPFSVG